MKTYRDLNPITYEESRTVEDVLREIRRTPSMKIRFPLSVRLVENPKFTLMERNLLFIPGAVSEWLHDAIHLALGRGFLARDEAFVIGYTMGSTGRYNSVANFLYKWISKNLYPKNYQFSTQDIDILNYAAIIGRALAPVSIPEIRYDEIKHLQIRDFRNSIVLDWETLLESYKMERRLYGSNSAIDRVVDRIEQRPAKRHNAQDSKHSIKRK